mmetsp:Transcript_160671/g.293478  ORF Transcript_160671/g.293478 Transcript_160671/m.293478 type:complete len:292 (-) Transcript_160671:2929-3804(-)
MEPRGRGSCPEASNVRGFTSRKHSCQTSVTPSSSKEATVETFARDCIDLPGFIAAKSSINFCFCSSKEEIEPSCAFLREAALSTFGTLDSSTPSGPCGSAMSKPIGEGDWACNSAHGNGEKPGGIPLKPEADTICWMYPCGGMPRSCKSSARPRRPRALWVTRSSPSRGLGLTRCLHSASVAVSSSIRLLRKDSLSSRAGSSGRCQGLRRSWGAGSGASPWTGDPSTCGSHDISFSPNPISTVEIEGNFTTPLLCSAKVDGETLRARRFIAVYPWLALMSVRTLAAAASAA